jgi:predicted  nucleic acid-binding Zn-ribbon protein
VSRIFALKKISQAAVTLEVNQRIKVILQEYRAEIDKLKTELAILKEAYNKLTQEYITLKADYQSLQKDYEKVCKENISLKIQVDAMKKRLSKIENKVNGNSAHDN